MTYEIEMLADVKARVGEGPVWDPSRQLLIWTDIQTGRLFEYDPASGENRNIYQGVYVGGTAVNKQGGLLLATWEGIGLWREGGEIAYIHKGILRGMQMQFNDVSADPGGRFFAGTYYWPEATGTLYRFDPNGSIHIVQDGVALSNGIGFSPDLKTMYYTDSAVRTIYAYDYDASSGDVSNRREFVVLPETEGITDGMTVDAEGFVWSAIWGGGCVIRFDPDGREERRISFPATQTASCMFGGADLNELYVTTAWSGTGEPPAGFEPAGYDYSAHRGGELYRVRLDIQGKPEFEADFPWPDA